MRKLIGLICFFPLWVLGATWVDVAVFDNSRIDIDRDSIDANEENVKAWFKEETLVRKQNAVGNYYRSAVTYEVFLCKERKTAIQKTVYYTEPNLSGSVVNDTDFDINDAAYTLVIPGSLGELKMKRACQAARKGGQ
jgi:hypothetical protein